MQIISLLILISLLAWHIKYYGKLRECTFTLANGTTIKPRVWGNCQWINEQITKWNGGSYLQESEPRLWPGNT